MKYKDLDAFYGTAVHGRYGTPVEELIGAENADRLVEVTSHLYGQYMAQAISVNMRNTSGVPVNASQEIKDALAYHTAYRLTQNKVSKIILQALLSIITICNLLAWFFSGNTKDLLYHNPCSIAGTASLIAGSELWSSGFLPKDIACLSDEELKEKKILDGWLFSLGWWTGSGERAQRPPKRFGIDVGRANER
jgi:hypothetical protein